MAKRILPTWVLWAIGALLLGAALANLIATANAAQPTPRGWACSSILRGRMFSFDLAGSALVETEFGAPPRRFLIVANDERELIGLSLLPTGAIAVMIDKTGQSFARSNRGAVWDDGP